MNLDYFFLEVEQEKPDLEVSMPLKHGYLIKNAFTLDEIIRYEEELHKLPWKIQEITVAGKKYFPQRETLGFATSSHLIENRSSFGLLFPEIVNKISQKVKQIIVRNISEIEEPIMNYCWGNRYRTGQDKVGKHKDDEKWHIPQDPIISVSFGEFRHFDIYDEYCRIDRYDLGFGDIFLMMPGFQQDYFHGVPVQKKVFGPRINLTFRSLDRPPCL